MNIDFQISEQYFVANIFLHCILVLKFDTQHIQTAGQLYGLQIHSHEIYRHCTIQYYVQSINLSLNIRYLHFLKSQSAGLIDYHTKINELHRTELWYLKFKLQYTLKVETNRLCHWYFNHFRQLFQKYANYLKCCSERGELWWLSESMGNRPTQQWNLRL